VAVAWQTVTASSADIWIGDLGRATFSRLSFSGSAATPVWSADGRMIYYMHIDPGGRKATIMRKPADGSRDAEPIVEIDARAYLKGVTQDGKMALIDYVAVAAGGGAGQVMQVTLAEHAKPEPIVASRFDEYGGRWSPDRRWLAYLSDESGRPEVYVRDISSNGGRWQISTTGGDEPYWSHDGRELYYRNESKLMVVPLDTRTTFKPGKPAMLFEGVYNLRSDTAISYDLHPSGDRFLMVRLTDEDVASTLTVATDWLAALRRLTSSASR
jgi:serine/threonine-protein kinase